MLAGFAARKRGAIRVSTIGSLPIIGSYRFSESATHAVRIDRVMPKQNLAYTTEEGFKPGSATSAQKMPITRFDHMEEPTRIKQSLSLLSYR